MEAEMFFAMEAARAQAASPPPRPPSPVTSGGPADAQATSASPPPVGFRVA